MKLRLRENRALNALCYTYDRYVLSPAACLPGQSVKRQFVPTRNGACPVYTCYDPSGRNFFDD